MDWEMEWWHVVGMPARGTPIYLFAGMHSLRGYTHWRMCPDAGRGVLPPARHVPCPGRHPLQPLFQGPPREGSGVHRVCAVSCGPELFPMWTFFWRFVCFQTEIHQYWGQIHSICQSILNVKCIIFFMIMPANTKRQLWSHSARMHFQVCSSDRFVVLCHYAVFGWLSTLPPHSSCIHQFINPVLVTTKFSKLESDIFMIFCLYIFLQLKAGGSECCILAPQLAPPSNKKTQYNLSSVLLPISKQQHPLPWNLSQQIRPKMPD